MNLNRGRWCLSVVLLLLSVSAAPARAQMESSRPTGSDAGVQASSLANADVISMLQSGFSPDAVIAVIQKAKSRFDLTSRGLAQLKEAKVPDAVIVAMVAAGDSSAEAPAPPQAPTASEPRPTEVSPPPPVQDQPEAPSERRQHFSFSLGGGPAYLAVGDYREVFDAWNSNRTDDKEYEAPSLGGDGTLDAIFHVTRNFGVGLGAGYVRASKMSDLASSDLPNSTTVTLSAFRVRLGAWGFLPLGRALEVYANVSPTLYVASLKDEGEWSYYTSDYTGRYYINGTWSDEGSRKQLGLEGAIGLKLKLGRSFALFVELGGRYAKLSPIEGSYDWSDNQGDAQSSEHAVLYRWESSYKNGAWKENLAITDEPQASGSYRYQNVRKGNVDFSGAAARIGFSVGF